MGHAMFYHLTHSSPQALVQLLVPKAVQQGWNVVIRSPDPDRLRALDDMLWQVPPDGFLPHAIAKNDAQDIEQTVLLTSDDAIPNAARYLLALDCASVSAAEIPVLDRACLVFDAQDQAQMTHARQMWKTLTDQGIAAQYWSEETGSWKLKHEKKPPA